ncbi:uncharacterized protein BX663DRAFT_504609, partial [Cokeromyces recurvatus]|uniref:uncharacterized protein n=1 Tax=Cokeromyces recurvatus TaxID=90255 RepID=UPI00221F66FE
MEFILFCFFFLVYIICWFKFITMLELYTLLTLMLVDECMCIITGAIGIVDANSNSLNHTFMLLCSLKEL